MAAAGFNFCQRSCPADGVNGGQQDALAKLRRWSSHNLAEACEDAYVEDEERAEDQRRIDQMTINIEKMRADIVAENKRFVVQVVSAAAALLAAGAGIATLALHLLGKL